MAANVRQYLRQLRPDILKQHFEFHSIVIPAGLWARGEAKAAACLAEHLGDDVLDPGQKIIADLVRCIPLATERGRTAMQAAARQHPQIIERLAELVNDHERALWLTISYPELFREAEELHYFDYFAEGSRGRRYQVPQGTPLHREDDHIKNFTSRMQSFFRSRDGSGASCHVEFIERASEPDEVQLSVYLQGLPDHRTEFVGSKFKRSQSFPAVEAAIVHSPQSGQITTVTKGGEKVHDAYVRAFMEELLQIEPKFTVIRPQRFHLERLGPHATLPPISALGVSATRVRKLRLTPPGRQGILALEAPAGEHGIDVYALAAAWLPNGRWAFDLFKVIHATISLHLERRAEETRSKTINVEITAPNSSNLRNLPNEHRRVAEAHLKKWGIMDAVDAGSDL